MNRIMKALFPFLFGFLVVFPGLCYGDEEEIFTIKIEPDALIILDLSGSMIYPPPGEWGYSDKRAWDDRHSRYNCTGNGFVGISQGPYNQYCKNQSPPATYKYAESEDCIGSDPSKPYPYYNNTSIGKVDCSRRAIAKRAIYTLLDDDKSGNDKNYNKNKIDKQDELSLGVRLGYMSFYGCGGSTFSSASDDSDYGLGCNRLRQGFQKLNDPALSNGYYRTIYESVTTDIENAGGKTPLAGSLDEARRYLDAHKAGDTAKACRSKFVIFITDGWDTLACRADPDHYSADITKGWSYKRRSATVAAAKALNDAGYKVFMIGFGGDMPTTLVNTLNWAAYYGGTDNPNEDNKENGAVISRNPSSLPVPGSPCTEEAVCTSTFQLTAGNCSTLGNQLGDDCCSNVGTALAPDCCNLAPNDPGFRDLTGYAFIAYSTVALNTALQTAMNYVKASRYSFTVASVSAARLQSGNFLYEASFVPYGDADPSWQGHLKKYRIDDSGNVVQPAVLDAGEVLRDRGAPRNMYTYLPNIFPGASITPFTNDNITPTRLGLSSTDTAGRDKVVGYFRGDAYTEEKWRLGDIFHSNPVTIDPPSIYFNDTHSWDAFDTFRKNNKTRDWLIVLGANDGQIHAFSAGDLAEKWSFIPPNLLPKLKLISHATEPALSKYHQFYVDGPVTVADVWLGSGDGLGKTANDWKTLMVVGLGKGVRESNSNSDPTYLWSSSPSCDSDFKRKHNPPHQYYCGYYAFDVTDTSRTQPLYKWRINLTDSKQGMYLDEPWSKMAIGRVKDGGNEKWVGFIGGGFTGDTNQKNRGYDDDDFETKGKRGGKGLFVVELSTGNILWSYTRDNNSNMDYPIPASPLVLDWDNDGFIDTAYIADLGGNVWRFRFCSLADGASCNTLNWKGSRLFDSTGVVRPVFSTPSVAMDASSQLWVFWGTGNRMSPLDTGGQDRFFAVKEKDFTSTYKVTDLQKLTTQAYGGTMAGWYMEFPSSGEKMLFDSSVFGGMVLFTTYTPTTGTDPCANSGTGRLYALAMMPITIDGVTYNAGAGLMSKPADTASKDGGNKSVSLGAGMPTAPLVSQKPREKPGATDLFVTTSGGGGTDTAVTSVGDLFTIPEPGKPCPPGTPPALCRLAQTPPQAQIIHWRDRRLLQ